jgi:DNA-binding CsgD family transcriptional regulator
MAGELKLLNEQLETLEEYAKDKTPALIRSLTTKIEKLNKKYARNMPQAVKDNIKKLTKELEQAQTLDVNVADINDATPFEKEVIWLSIEGKSNYEIAKKFNLGRGKANSQPIQIILDKYGIEGKSTKSDFNIRSRATIKAKIK